MMTIPGNPWSNGHIDAPKSPWRSLTPEEAQETWDQQTKECERIARERAWVRQFGGYVRYT